MPSKKTHSVIRRIQELLKQADLSDVQRFGQLAAEYALACQPYIDNCAKVQALLERKMHLEAAALAQSFNPGLLEQYASLQFPGMDRFSQILQMYDLEIPAEIDGAVIQALEASKEQNAGLWKLMEDYRKMAWEGAPEEKLPLLRQIVAASPDSAQWQENLQAVEQQYLEKLSGEARLAIENEDFQRLADIQALLSEPEWKDKLRPEIGAKINRVLEEEKRRQEENQAQALIDDINALYSQGTEHKKLGDALRQWHDFKDNCNLPQSQSQQKQIEAAEEFWQQKQDELERQLDFKDNLNALNQALEQDSELETLDRLFYRLRQSEYELPEELRRRFEACRSMKLLIAKRKRMAMFAAALLLLLAASAGTLILCKQLSDWYLARQFQQTLSIAMQAREMSEALDIKNKLLQKHPQLLRKARLQAQLKKLEELKKKEDERRATFIIVQNEMLALLPFYAENPVEAQNLLQKAAENWVGETQMQAYEQLAVQLNEQHAKYLQEQEKKLQELFDLMREQYQSFKATLQKQQYSEARHCIEKVKEYIQQAENLKDIPETLRQNYEFQVQLFQKMPEELQQNAGDWQFVKLMNTVEKILLEQFPEAEKSQNRRVLQDLLHELELLQGEIEPQLPAVSETHQEAWLEIKAKLEYARQVWQRLESLHEQAEDEFRKLFHSPDYDHLKMALQKYLQQYPNSPHYNYLEQFKREQIQPYEDFSQQQHWENCSAQLASLQKQQTQAKARLRQKLELLSLEARENPLKMIAFSHVEFYFQEEPKARTNMEILYQSYGLSKKLLVEFDSLKYNNRCKIEFDGKKMPAQVSFPLVFTGNDADFLHTAPHQQLLFELENKLEALEQQTYWGGGFWLLGMELINPANEKHSVHDIYKRVSILQSLLRAYLNEENNTAQPETSQDPALQQLSDSLLNLIESLPDNFHKNWLSASQFYPEPYIDFRQRARALFGEFPGLQIERMMRQLEREISTFFTPLAILYENGQDEPALNLLIEPSAGPLPLYVLAEDEPKFKLLSARYSPGRKLHKSELTTLGDIQMPMLLFTLKPKQNNPGK